MQGSMYPANSTYNYSDAYGYSGTISYAGWDTVISAYHRQRAYYKCGDEGKGEQCWFKGTSATLPVRYGSTSTDTWAPWRYANSGILCNNATWGGDPAPNYVKICQVLYEEGSYKVPPGDPIYNAAYAGYVYKAGTPTTTYTATYSGTVYGN